MPLFDRDRYQRLDGSGGAGAGGGRRSSPSSCSTATIVLFVALCLVGAWMMASTGNVPMTVSPEDKPAAVKEDDASSIDVTDGVKGGGNGGDTPQTTDEAADHVGKKVQDAGDADKKDQDAGDTAKTTHDVGDTGVKDGGVDTQTTTDAVANTTTGGTEEGESGKLAGDKVAEGETTPPKNQTFSDENGKTEGGEVVNPEDPDKQSANDAPTDGKDTGDQASGDADEAPSTDTKENASQADKNTDQSTEEEPKDTKGTSENADEASTETKPEKSSDDAPTDAKATGDGGTSSKNQTSFDDENGKMDGVDPVTEDGKVTEKSSEQVSTSGNDGGGEVQTTDDDTITGAASNNQIISDQSDESNTTTTKFAAVDGGNGTTSQTTEDDAAANSTAAATEEINPAAEKELLPSGQAELLNETASAVAQNGSFPTQASVSSAEKKARDSNKNKSNGSDTAAVAAAAHEWKLCNVTAGEDYIPCLDNEAAIKKLKSTKHYEHRERHCPAAAPTCLVPLPDSYRRSIPWPYSRDKIWYHNVPHTKLASYKGHQNWVKVSGEHLTFPGGGTQFKNGAAHYIDLIEEALPGVAWGRRSRVVLDVGCGVASFGGFLFDRDALTMSLAPKDEHEAQVQFALERGIPAISAVMGTKRLPFPGGAYDAVHCARCRVPWHIEGGKLLLEVNRLLRPGGLFVWSATPVYRKTPEDVQIWHDMAALTKSMCWEMAKKTNDTVDETAMVIFKKPTSNGCYSNRKQPEPPLCDDSDDQDAAWNITLRACMHSLPTNKSARGARWPEQWPERLSAAPYWLSPSQVGVYGKPAPDDFAADDEHWSHVVNSSYLAGAGIDWSNVRNVMDMRAVYGGFAAALKDMNVWVMNVVPVDSPDTLPIIYERGLFGMYHDWCESFSTYPRSYDLLHADHLFSKLKNRCKLLPAMVEVDRILRPEGKLIVRDDHDTAAEVETILRSLHWEVRMTVSKQGEVMLCAEKTMWRPTEVEAAATAS